MNKDGNLDIVVANSDIHKVGVFLGYGNGTFHRQITYSVAYKSRPFCIVIGDLNSDNQLDMVTANWGSTTVGIFFGYGNGTFADAMFYSTGIGSEPRSVGISDFNNDNISDIVVANFGTNSIVVLFGLGDRRFLLGTPYFTGSGSYLLALAIGDLNNDSRLDVAVSNLQSHSIQIFLANGTQYFGSMATYITGVGSKPHSVTTGDLNNDGWPDIVTANYGTDNVGIFFGSANGDFQRIKTYPTGFDSAPYFVAITDIDNDNHLDIVVANSGSDNIAIFFGYGDGTFAIGLTYSTGAGSHPCALAIGDVNNDNRSDIVIANSDTSNILILYNYDNGTFMNSVSYYLGYGYHPYSVVVKDLNQDNWLDIAIACKGTDHVEILIKMC